MFGALLPFLSSASGAALISGGAALVGGIADRAQENRNYKRNDLLKTMKDAKEAGFHPLEALRAGYTQTQAAQAPRISSLGVFANAVDQASSMYRDEMQRQKNDALIDAQIANINADTARMGSVSALSASVGSTASSEPRVGQRGFDKFGNPQTAGAEVGGADFEFDPDTSDQEVFETRHGDVVGAVVGLGILGRDLGYSMYKAAPRFWQNTAGVLQRVQAVGNTEFRPARLYNGSVGDFNGYDPQGGGVLLGGVTR